MKKRYEKYNYMSLKWILYFWIQNGKTTDLQRLVFDLKDQVNLSSDYLLYMKKYI